MINKFFVFLLLFIVESCSAGMEWSQFEWTSSSIGGKKFDRVAILVPMKLKNNPRTFWMQLDTGSDFTVLYQIPFSQLNYPIQPIKGQEAFVPLSGTLGNCPFDSFPVFMYEDFGDSLNDKKEYPVIGSVGQDMLVGKIFVIDFPKGKFCLTDSLDPEVKSLLSQASWVNLNRRDNKLFVHLQIADTSSDDFFYDTGASLFPLTTSKAMWQKLTGKKGDEKSNVRMSVSSWGNKVVLIGAPVKGNLTLGTLKVANPMVYFDKTGTIAFSSEPFKTDGLIGNALFYDEYTVVIDLVHNRFGIIKDR
jgi:hypothetical protein